MLYLPEYKPYESKVIVPINTYEWYKGSLAEEKDQFFNPTVQQRYKVVGYLSDGYKRWVGWFDSRDEFDVFLTDLIRYKELSIPIPRSSWELPTPHWNPDIDEGMRYEFASNVFLTTTGSTHIWTVPGDFGATNTFHCIGGGGSGGPNFRAGGSGASYGQVVNQTISPGTSITYSVGTAGSWGSNNGITAGSTWIRTDGNTTAPTTSSQGALGKGGQDGGDPTAAGGQSGSIGTTTALGGNSLAAINGARSGGGGGAGGPHGAGTASIDAVPSGGQGDAGFGGGRGTTNGAGGNGTEFDSSHGCGGGGGYATTGSGGNGGNYGGGSGGGGSGAGQGAPSQGLLAIVYTPAVRAGFNLAMLGF